MTEEIKKGVWCHFKGNNYLVLGEVINSETRETMVLYVPLYGEYKMFVRPKAMFLDEVDRPEYGYKGPRFRCVANGADPSW